MCPVLSTDYLYCDRLFIFTVGNFRSVVFECFFAKLLIMKNIDIDLSEYLFEFLQLVSCGFMLT